MQWQFLLPRSHHQYIDHQHLPFINPKGQTTWHWDEIRRVTPRLVGLFKHVYLIQLFSTSISPSPHSQHINQSTQLVINKQNVLQTTSSAQVMCAGSRLPSNWLPRSWRKIVPAPPGGNRRSEFSWEVGKSSCKYCVVLLIKYSIFINLCDFILGRNIFHIPVKQFSFILGF